MERIKKFFWDDKATAEATSTVIMVAAVGILLAAGLGLYYGGIQGFFTDTATQFEGLPGQFQMPAGAGS